MYTPTTITDASPRAQALSHELTTLIRERRGQDPSLSVPDALVALELTKASLLEEFGATPARRQVVLVAAVALLAAIVGISLFLMSA